MNPADRKLYNRLLTIQRKISEVDTEGMLESEMQSFIANASASIEYAIQELRKQDETNG